MLYLCNIQKTPLLTQSYVDTSKKDMTIRDDTDNQILNGRRHTQSAFIYFRLEAIYFHL